MSTKAIYKVKNWSAYNKSLELRGSVTLWIPEETTSAWFAKPTGNPGNPFIYSDAAVECALTVRSFFHMPLRATVGFIKSIFQIMSLDLRIPCYSTLSRRAASLELELNIPNRNEPIHLVLDSTGLKVYGEGEWKIKMHGKDKRRVWRKFHIGVDAETKEILTVELTDKDVHDSTQTSRLIPYNKKIAGVYADGAYDNHNAYEPIAKCKAKALIPPRSGAALCTSKKKITPGIELRNGNIKGCWKYGRKVWKEKTGYHKRSLVENAMYRVKTIFGEKLKSREIKRQKTESKIRSIALNRITHLGMPISIKVI